MKAVLALAAAIAVASIPAEAAPRKHSPRSYAPQAQIACTQYGCMPVPPGCYREAGRTGDDSPSGFDVITCGGGAYTLYGRR